MTDIAFFDDKVYAGITKAAASDFQGVKAYDVTDPTDIQFLDSCETPGGIGEMLFYGEFIRATLGNAGVALIDYSVPTDIKYSSLQSGNTVVSANSIGNRAGNTIKVSYSLAHPAAISIVLYNLQGKHIRTLFAGKNETGTHWQEFPTDKMISGMHVLLLKAGDAVLSTVSFPFVR